MKLDLAFSQNWASCLFCSTWFLSFLVYFSFTWSGIWTAFLKQCESFCFVFIFCHFNLCSFLDLHCQPFSSRWLWRRAGMHGDGSNTPRVNALFFFFFKKNWIVLCFVISITPWLLRIWLPTPNAASVQVILACNHLYTAKYSVHAPTIDLQWCENVFARFLFFLYVCHT